MKFMNRLARLTLSLGISFLSGTFATGQSAPPTAPPTSLKWYAEKAKLRGDTTVERGNLVGGDAPRPLKELVKQSLVVDGKVESSTVDASDGYHIFTWYKIKVLTKGATPEWRGVFNRGSVPDTVEHVHGDEFLLRLTCGAVVIDGVTVTQQGQAPLTVDKRYVFFLEPLTDNAYVTAYQSTPVELDEKGLLIHSPHSAFSQRLQQFQSVQDVLAYSK
jgi:hypothetical protein